MPFGTIAAVDAASQTTNFEPRRAGYYVEQGITFSDPTNEFRVSPATRVDGKGNMAFSVTRIKDVDDATTGERHRMTLNLVGTIPALGGFTATDLDNLCAEISSFVTAITIDRMLQGES